MRFFRHCPAPHHRLSQQQPGGSGSSSPSDAELAFASLLALRLLPEIREAWGSAPFLVLLTHADPAVRWAATQALGLQLGLVGVFFCVFSWKPAPMQCT